MNIIFRVDASINIGSGHVMRCLTLADLLSANGASVTFICARTIGNLEHLVDSGGYNCILIKDELTFTEDETVNTGINSDSWKYDADEVINSIIGENIDCIIVDHYGLDYRWHTKLKKHCKTLFVIDDLANRMLNCDILLDQSIGREYIEYQTIVPPNCQLLLGTKYALLRPEFHILRKQALQRKNKSGSSIKNILIFIGGGNWDDLIQSILDTIINIRWMHPVTINVVTGWQPQMKKRDYYWNKNPNIEINIRSHVNNMAQLMFEADLSIGSAGTATWERCALGLPTLVKVVAENQMNIASKLYSQGAIKLWDTQYQLKKMLERLIANPAHWTTMHKASLEICDGKGTNRAAKIITSST